MSNIVLAQQMIESLKKDWKDAWNNGERYVGHINYRDYSKNFGVSEEDIKAYCQTLTMMTPIYSTCFLCGREWVSLEKEVRLTGNCHIEWVDSFTMWCCGEDGNEHDTMWYHQYKDGRLSFNRELDEHPLFELEVRWNCSCMVEECHDKNVIVDHSNEDYKILKFCSQEELPYNISREDILKLIKDVK
jgi:hypothetical protein